MNTRAPFSVNRPLRRLGTAVVVLLSALLLNVGFIQVVKSDEYRGDPNNKRTALDDINRQRGLIIAAGGTVLARSVPSDDQYRYQRSYPGGAAFANVTGYLSLRYGSTGLENTYGNVLSGSDPNLIVDNMSDLVTGRDPRGGNVELTLVPKVQQAAYQALTDKGFIGAVVALQPKTGQVLALATSPSFNPNPFASHLVTTQRSAYNALVDAANSAAPDQDVNRGIVSVYPPGSTFKLIVAAAALQDGFTPNTAVTGVPKIRLPAAGGATLSNFGGESCAGRGGSDVSLTDALAHSCNTAFAQVAMKVGADRLKAQAAAFGVGQARSLGGLEVAPSRIGDLADAASVAQSGIGQRDVAFTPLQDAVVAATIANGGQRMQPYLVSRVTKPDLSLLQPPTEPTSAGQAVPAAVAGQLKDMMLKSEQVMATRSDPALGIASKTGTAEHGDNPKLTPPHTWYVAFAPADDPKIAVAVFVADGGDRGLNATGATVAAPIGHAVIEAALTGGD